MTNTPPVAVASTGTNQALVFTGTGGGFERFCAGVGGDTPDIANASRRMKKKEFDTCAKNGVKDIVEIQVGIDGIALGEAQRGPGFKLSEEDVYKALAANPYGKPNTAKTWKDVNPALPAVAISVFGPPSTSGSDSSAPTPQARAATENRPASEGEAWPPEAVSSRFGNQAASAAPRRDWAAASACWAAATSARRASTVLGMPGGTCGKAGQAAEGRAHRRCQAKGSYRASVALADRKWPPRCLSAELHRTLSSGLLNDRRPVSARRAHPTDGRPYTGRPGKGLLPGDEHSRPGTPRCQAPRPG